MRQQEFGDKQHIQSMGIPENNSDAMVNNLQNIYQEVDFEVIHMVFHAEGEQNIIKTRKLLDEMLGRNTAPAEVSQP
jgi:hypothetical protein